MNLWPWPPKQDFHLWPTANSSTLIFVERGRLARRELSRRSDQPLGVVDDRSGSGVTDHPRPKTRRCPVLPKSRHRQEADVYEANVLANLR